MDFSTWLTRHYRKPDESVTRAVHRLSIQINVGWTTVYRALKGSQVQPKNARKISTATIPAGKVKPLVSVETLVMAPTRVEMADRRRGAA